MEEEEEEDNSSCANALCKHLVKKPGTCFNEIVVLLFNGIVILVMRSSICTALESKVHQTAREAKRVFYLYTLSATYAGSNFT